ncbi:hypothetical protein ANN_11419 [Periplaneta americana]|uniref:Uncharacterized protein n=1 Tax=Periplaneta americana TaxID=6978 RepID=A0ABQ8T5M5_PERAM|nr:hypothetical protein ANN_11419 [Periplaneta americana]
MTKGGSAREDMRRTSEGMKRLPDISDCEDRIDRALKSLLAKKKSVKKGKEALDARRRDGDKKELCEDGTGKSPIPRCEEE